MANPRQRRKAKSNSAIVSLRRHQKKRQNKHGALQAPKPLQDSWDVRKTVTQNYANLGLTRSLRLHASGGTDHIDAATVASFEIPVAPSLSKSTEFSDQELRPMSVKKGRIIRDQYGNIVDVVLPENDDPCTSSSQPTETEVAQPHPIVSALQNRADAVVKKSRHSSSGELKTLRALITTHGTDIDAMARDRRRNPMQRTVGQLKTSIGKAGGFKKILIYNRQ